MRPPPDGEVTYDLGLLERSAAKWKHSAALRTVYADIFRDVAARLHPGSSLEVGAGIGIAKLYVPDLVTSDVVATPYVNRAASAYALAETGERWANVIAMDVLHHLRRPLHFFASTAAVLEPGGRLILVEPAATPWGRCFYQWAHHEPCRPAEIRPPFEFADDEGEFANMGMGWGLFERHREELTRRLTAMGLALSEVHYRDAIAYPATGGFSRPAMLPAGVLRALLAGERRLPVWLRRLIALRMLVVITRLP